MSSFSDSTSATKTKQLRVKFPILLSLWIFKTNYFVLSPGSLVFDGIFVVFTSAILIRRFFNPETSGHHTQIQTLLNCGNISYSFVIQSNKIEEEKVKN